MVKKLSQCNTISDFAEYSRSLKLSYDKLHLKSKIQVDSDKNMVVNTTCIINKYYDILMAHTEVITLSDNNYLSYRFQPKRYCYDKYGTTELWGLLLKINNLTSAAEFNLKTLRVFTVDIFDVLNEILILEREDIQANAADVG